MTIIPNDAPIPDFLTGRPRRNGGGPAIPVDQQALADAMAGGTRDEFERTNLRGAVPAEVAAYAPPKSRVVDAGEFDGEMAALKDHIRRNAADVSRALRMQADAVDHGADEACAAIDMATTDAHVRQASARTMAAAFAEIDHVGQVRAILGRQAAAEPDTRQEPNLAATLHVPLNEEDGA